MVLCLCLEDNVFVEKFDNDLHAEFEYEFHKKFPKLRIAIEGSYIQYIVVYKLNIYSSAEMMEVAYFEGGDYTCDFLYQKPNDLKLLKDSRLDVNDIAKFYLRFMKNHFPDYKQAYINFMNERAQDLLEDKGAEIN